MCFLWKTLPVKFVESWPFLFSLLYFYISVSYLWSCFVLFCFVEPRWSKSWCWMTLSSLLREWKRQRERRRDRGRRGERDEERKKPDSEADNLNLKQKKKKIVFDLRTRHVIIWDWKRYIVSIIYRVFYLF